jgi:prolyl-tRNA synthetase
VRAKLDARVDTSFGRRATDWELKGVPVRLDVGPRDLAEGNVTLVDRLRGTKDTIPAGEAVARATAALRDGQAALLDEATARREAATTDVTTVADAAEAAKTGFARIPWATLGAEGETQLAASSVTVRCLQRPDGSVPDSDDEPEVVAVVARAY